MCLLETGLTVLTYTDLQLRLCMPRPKMAEGHIEPYLSGCASVCVSRNRVRDITKPFMLRFEKKIAQMIIMTSQCIANKNRVARSEVKVTVRT